ncbi:hypothetical protein GH714_002841 [Hevea brasiliensis]|uniref:Uncharacterized protein n=1 Tax=Hevea brasiliensis TaxID=3981 RepID=A0A6A6LHZ7_HEVBR|nr:hypothetical protein GH714_002841 [Hevea brasiliensis]
MAKGFMDNLPRWLRWDIILSIIAVVAEAISAAFEQTSPHKVKAAKYGVIMAIVSVLLSFTDLAYNKCMLLRDKTRRPDDKHHYHYKLQWEFADSFGLICSLLTLISSCLHYNFLSNGKKQPIQFSMIPLAFSVCVFCSRVFRQTSNKPTFILKCKYLGPMNLQIESDGRERTQFGCPMCQREQMDPQGV